MKGLLLVLSLPMIGVGFWNIVEVGIVAWLGAGIVSVLAGITHLVLSQYSVTITRGR